MLLVHSNAGGIDPGLLSHMGYGAGHIPTPAYAGDIGYAHAAAAAASAATQAYPSQPAPTFELQQQQPQINLSAAFQSLHVNSSMSCMRFITNAHTSGL